ncbi:dynein light chain Tctex-type protein 2B-like [Mercenaria mercenaria]|uniref:dynein light chain Tctex-type protein 2B-like n=1 Tax=Mercenaria mercenaria TaxID=6596 RepID=UPI00234F5BAD|nr:dynein light chain Tctex-type protein 2B-like [Mercenaria mercenaria]
MTSEVASSVDGTNLERHDAEAHVTTSFMNAMKSKRRSVSLSNTDISSVSGCTAGRGSTKETLNTKESPCWVSTASSDKTCSTKNPLLRRRSTLKGIATSITGMLKLRRLTVPSVPSVVKPKINLENTYKMSPDVGNHIAPSKIEQAAEQILKDEIGSREYNSYLAGDMACTISAKIKSKVKEMNFPRYRIICQVIITEVKDQGIEAASRCLWDANCDNYTTVYYKNESIAAIAMLYGVYFE